MYILFVVKYFVILICENCHTINFTCFLALSWLLADHSHLSSIKIINLQPTYSVLWFFTHSLLEHCSTLIGRVQAKLLIQSNTEELLDSLCPLLTCFFPVIQDQYSPALSPAPSTYLPFTCSCQPRSAIPLTSIWDLGFALCQPSPFGFCLNKSSFYHCLSCMWVPSQCS